VVNDYDASLLNNIANGPEQPLIEISADWLA